MIHRLTGSNGTIKSMVTSIEVACKVDKREDIRTWGRIVDKIEESLGDYQVRYTQVEEEGQTEARKIQRDKELEFEERNAALMELQVQADQAIADLNEELGENEATVYLSEHEYGLLRNLWGGIESFVLNRRARELNLEIDDMINTAVKGDLDSSGQFTEAEDSSNHSVTSFARRAGKRR